MQTSMQRDLHTAAAAAMELASEHDPSGPRRGARVRCLSQLRAVCVRARIVSSRSALPYFCHARCRPAESLAQAHA
jgi:hypothetical protein